MGVASSAIHMSGLVLSFEYAMNAIMGQTWVGVLFVVELEFLMRIIARSALSARRIAMDAPK
jgi:hypothetical protein